MNIKEDYVSFETAKLLKGKGFDWHTYAYYEDENNPNISLHASKAINWNKTEFISKPTLQMTMKWLREVHKILILVEYDCPVFSSDIYKMDDIDEYGGAKSISPTFANCKNYEEACEAAIKYCLENLI